jgi:hypothetical protein
MSQLDVGWQCSTQRRAYGNDGTIDYQQQHTRPSYNRLTIVKARIFVGLNPSFQTRLDDAQLQTGIFPPGHNAEVCSQRDWKA